MSSPELGSSSRKGGEKEMASRDFKEGLNLGRLLVRIIFGYK